MQNKKKSCQYPPVYLDSSLPPPYPPPLFRVYIEIVDFDVNGAPEGVFLGSNILLSPEILERYLKFLGQKGVFIYPEYHKFGLSSNKNWLVICWSQICSCKNLRPPGVCLYITNMSIYKPKSCKLLKVPSCAQIYIPRLRKRLYYIWPP